MHPLKKRICYKNGRAKPIYTKALYFSIMHPVCMTIIQKIFFFPPRQFRELFAFIISRAINLFFWKVRIFQKTSRLSVLPLTWEHFSIGNCNASMKTSALNCLRSNPGKSAKGNIPCTCFFWNPKKNCKTGELFCTRISNNV